MTQPYVYIHPPLLSLSHPTSRPAPLGHHIAPGLSPCVIEQYPTSYLFYAWQRMCQGCFPSSFHSLLQLCAQVHSLHLWLYSCPENRLISTIFLDSVDIYALIYDICFSLSDLFHSV